jgi:hypothetical protein
VSHRVRRLASVAGVVAAAGILLGPSAEGARAPASSCGTGTLVATPNVGKFDLLRGIAAISPRDVWAVGIHLAGNSERALVEHWDGMRWRVAGVPQPATFHVDLNAVTAVSATDVWAVGGTVSRRAHLRTVIEHWNGRAWAVVAAPQRPHGRDSLSAVSASAATDVWAAGIDSRGGKSFRTLIEDVCPGTADRWSV